MSIVAFGLGLSSGSSGGGYYAVDAVTMEVDLPDIILEYAEDEVVLVLDDEGTELIFDEEDIELEVD